jgi:hypothetical protein
MCRIFRFVGAKQVLSALPAFDPRGKMGEAEDAFASPLQLNTQTGDP